MSAQCEVLCDIDSRQPVRHLSSCAFHIEDATEVIRPILNGFRSEEKRDAVLVVLLLLDVSWRVVPIVPLRRSENTDGSAEWYRCQNAAMMRYEYVAPLARARAPDSTGHPGASRT